MVAESDSVVATPADQWSGSGAGAPECWGWGPHYSISWPALLTLICSVVLVAFFVAGLYRRRYLWEPLWLGGLAMALGLLGTVWDLIETLSRAAARGAPINSADLAEGGSKALLSTLIGLAVLIAGIAGSFILWLRRVPDARPYVNAEEESQAEALD